MQSVSRHVVSTLTSVFRPIGPSLRVHAGLQSGTKICALQSPEETISGLIIRRKAMLRCHVS